MNNSSSLNQQQILQDVHSCPAHALRVELGSNTGADLQLDSTVDSITAVPVTCVQKASLTSANSGTVIGPFSIVGINTLCLYLVVSGSGGTADCVLQISPSDSDDVWFQISAPSTTPIAVCARRAKVVMTGTIESGTVDVYIVGSA